MINLQLAVLWNLYDDNNAGINEHYGNNVPNSKVPRANMGPPGSCRPQRGPILAPWTLLWGVNPQWRTVCYVNTLLGKRLLHPGMRYVFGDYSYSICLWGLKAGWLAGSIFFYVLYALFCLTCVSVNLWWHLLILEKLIVWAYLNIIGWQLWQIWSNKLDFFAWCCTLV